MKHGPFHWIYFSWANVFVLLTSTLSALFSAKEAEFFYFGFPSPFLTIHVSHDLTFAVHLGLGNLVIDLLLGYMICALVVYLKRTLTIRLTQKDE